MLSAVVLVALAFAAGVTGAWSPCGFSMVETLGSAAPRLGGRVVRTSCATFTLGALAGGALTFTALGALGRLAGAPGHAAGIAAAVAIALLAALGEALGVRVVPQIRRQVPEPWRRTLPLPLAAALYGVLLGLGFTTFVLTLAVWALAGIAIALGSPLAGLLIGLGFGAGRALPVVVMAPRYATLGERLERRMAEQPILLRRLRLADGALLVVLALALVMTGTAGAAEPPAPSSAIAAARAADSTETSTLGSAAASGAVAISAAVASSTSSAGIAAVRIASGATDPSFAGGVLAWQGPDGVAVLQAGRARERVSAQNVAVGGLYLATRTGGLITVTNRVTGAVVTQRNAPGATQLAVSASWLVWRAPRLGGGDRLFAARLPALADAHVVAGAGLRATLGRPSLDGARLVYAVATRGASRIVALNLATGRRSVALNSPLTELSQPSLLHRRLLFVEATYCSQRLRITTLHGHRQFRTLLTIGSTAHRDAGHEPGYTTQGSEPSHCPRGTPHRTGTILWTTALTPSAAYVTLLQGMSTQLMRVPA